MLRPLCFWLAISPSCSVVVTVWWTHKVGHTSDKIAWASIKNKQTTLYLIEKVEFQETGEINCCCLFHTYPCWLRSLCRWQYPSPCSRSQLLQIHSVPERKRSSEQNTLSPSPPQAQQRADEKAEEIRHFSSRHKATRCHRWQLTGVKVTTRGQVWLPTETVGVNTVFTGEIYWWRCVCVGGSILRSHVTDHTFATSRSTHLWRPSSSECKHLLTVSCTPAKCASLACMYTWQLENCLKNTVTFSF